MFNFLNDNNAFDGILSYCQKIPNLSFEDNISEKVKELSIKAIESFIDHGASYLGGDYFGKNLADRYEYHLDEAKFRSGEARFNFSYTLKDKGQGVTTEEPRWEGSEYTSNITRYKTPQNAIQEIPVDANLVYRGMSWEGWKQIKQSGYIQSKGGYNTFDSQKNMIFFGKQPIDAFSYASGSTTPIFFRSGYLKPGVIIAVDKQGGIEGPSKDLLLSEYEFVFTEPIPISRIKHVWIIKPVKSLGEGKQEIVCDIVYEKDSDGHYTQDENGNLKMIGVENCRQGSAFPISIQFSIIEYQGKY